MKKCNMILTEKQPKYRHYLYVKLWIWTSYRWKNVTIWSKWNNGQAKFTYSPVGKAFEKQIKTIDKQRKKQIEALEVLKHNTQKLEIKDASP